MLKFIKDYLTPITCALAMLGGIAYSSGLRDEKITNVIAEYQDLKVEVVKLKEAVIDLKDEIRAQSNKNRK